MGHRKHSAPRRGSLAFRPRARHHTLLARVRTWPTLTREKPVLLGLPAYKTAMTHVITVDDREKTPNFGKTLFNSASILAVPPVTILGFRAYRNTLSGEQGAADVYSDNLPKELERKTKTRSVKIDQQLEKLEKILPEVSRFAAVVASVPREAGLSIKKAYVFEVGVGGDKAGALDYLKGLLGKQVKVSDIIHAGEFVDTVAVTKGKGFEGPVTRFGIKRKQHKSRKSVRAVGVLSPWHPATVMYTVPRAGQHGFHQRVEGNKRVLLVSSTSDGMADLKHDFQHFGKLEGDFVILKGSVQGPPKRVVTLRLATRIKKKKMQPPKIIEIGNIFGGSPR